MLHYNNSVTAFTTSRYKIISELGSGSTGTVFLAYDKLRDEKVALKLLHRCQTDKFKREFWLISCLSHPRIVKLYDLDKTREGNSFISMEYLKGESLNSVKTPLPVKDTAKILYQITEGLSFLHNQGIIHNDLKPSNIILTNSGVKIIDFGLATKEFRTAGTLKYMAPEKFSADEIDFRVDLYSLGLIGLELLDANPFEQLSGNELIEAKLHFQPQRLHSENLLIKSLTHLLQPNPFKRARNTLEIKYALANLLNLKAKLETSSSLPETRLVGRTKELEKLFSLIKTSPQPISISGVKGIGKTKLLKELRKALINKGEKVVFIQGQEILKSITDELVDQPNIVKNSPNAIKQLCLLLKNHFSKSPIIIVEKATPQQTTLLNQLHSSGTIRVIVEERRDSKKGITLTKFNKKETKEFIQLLLGSIVNKEEFSNYIFRTCNGNPGRVREKLHHLIKTRALMPTLKGYKFLPDKIKQEKPPRINSIKREILSYLYLVPSGLPFALFEKLFKPSKASLLLSELLEDGLIIESERNGRSYFQLITDSGFTFTLDITIESQKKLADILINFGDKELYPAIAKLLRASGLVKKALYYSKIGADEARKNLKYYTALYEYIFLAEESSKLTERVKYLKLTGLMNRKLGDLERAMKYYKQALEFAERTSDKKLIYECLNDIGVIEFDKIQFILYNE